MLRGLSNSASRRTFLEQGALVITAASLTPHSLWAGLEQPLRIGMITDLHHADKPPAGTRYYRQTLAKLAEARKQFAESRINMLVELGDLIDAADTVETELEYLTTIQKPFAEICPDRHCVLGNHCVDTLTKEEFLAGVQQEKSYYSFDRCGVHFVVLDSCFRSDGTPYGRKNFTWTDPNIPDEELQWLERDLQSTDGPTIVFAHQRLDVANHYGVKNQEAVRKILQSNGRVHAVFQGHSHQNDVKEIDGIVYCTLAAMVEGDGAENNGYSILTVGTDGSLRLSGYRRQQDYDWPIHSP